MVFGRKVKDHRSFGNACGTGGQHWRENKTHSNIQKIYHLFSTTIFLGVIICVTSFAIRFISAYFYFFQIKLKFLILPHSLCLSLSLAVSGVDLCDHSDISVCFYFCFCGFFFTAMCPPGEGMLKLWHFTLRQSEQLQQSDFQTL